jgi:hypothetical protein
VVLDYGQHLFVHMSVIEPHFQVNASGVSARAGPGIRAGFFHFNGRAKNVYSSYVKAVLGDSPAVLDRERRFIHILNYGTHSFNSLYGAGAGYEEMVTKSPPQRGTQRQHVRPRRPYY